LSVITLPGVYSVIVPPPSVVVVVVVVLDVCAHANGATTASAMLSIVFFIGSLPLNPSLATPGDSSSMRGSNVTLSLDSDFELNPVAR
jgi:hypothetical protein